MHGIAAHSAKIAVHLLDHADRFVAEDARRLLLAPAGEGVQITAAHGTQRDANQRFAVAEYWA